MHSNPYHSLAVVLALLPAVAAPARAAQYTVDAAHTAVTFNVEHLGISWTHGRFNDASGSFVFDKADPTKSSFYFSIKAESIDTNNTMRDEHLRSPDFLNVKQFPIISFRSTVVKPEKDGYALTGEFTLHGVTRPITLVLKGGKEAEFPKGTQRIGFTTGVSLKRSEFGMDKLAGAVGDDIHIVVSFEGVKK